MKRKHFGAATVAAALQPFAKRAARLAQPVLQTTHLQARRGQARRGCLLCQPLAAAPKPPVRLANPINRRRQLS